MNLISNPKSLFNKEGSLGRRMSQVKSSVVQNAAWCYTVGEMHASQPGLPDIWSSAALQVAPHQLEFLSGPGAPMGASIWCILKL